MTDDLVLATADQLIQRYREGSLSPVEVARETLGRIEDLNHRLNAYCHVDSKSALAMARASEKRWRLGKPLGSFDGVTVSVKDLSLTKGWPTRRGSLTLSADGPWTVDAPSVARMREGGAVLMGKTSVPEFGAKGVTHSRLVGVTRNPWNPRLTPGGSSGGAAVAVASGMCALALASDAAGSIRIPASFTGVMGFKPSFGVVPDYPASYLGSLAVIGPIVRSVRDCALALDVITRPDPRDFYAIPSMSGKFTSSYQNGVARLRIAYSYDLGLSTVDPEITKQLEAAVKALESLGAIVEPVGTIFEDPSSTLRTLLSVGLARAFTEFGIAETQYDLIDPSLRDLVEEGKRQTLNDYLRAKREQEHLGVCMRKFHERYELLLSPTLPILPFDAGIDAPIQNSYVDGTNWRPFPSPFNLTHQPAASVPCGFSATGLPIGLQIVGPVYRDDLVLRAAASLEEEFPIVLPDDFGIASV